MTVADPERVIIRPMTKFDLTAVASIEKQSGGAGRDKRELWLALQREYITGWTATMMGKVVGYAFCQSGDRLNILWIGVHQHYRRMGIGSALLAKLTTFAKAIGSRFIQAVVHDDATVRAFFWSHGYVAQVNGEMLVFTAVACDWPKLECITDPKEREGLEIGEELIEEALK